MGFAMDVSVCTCYIYDVLKHTIYLYTVKYIFWKYMDWPVYFFELDFLLVSDIKFSIQQCSEVYQQF